MSGYQNKIRPLRVANERRSQNAAAAAIPAVRQALALLGPDIPPLLIAAGKLRLAHPDLTLTRLGRLARPPASRFAMAARLRRLMIRAVEKQEDDSE